jgi:hypothetical protein
MKKHKLIGLGIAIFGVLAYVIGEIGSLHRMIGLLSLVVGIGWFMVGMAYD